MHYHLPNFSTIGQRMVKALYGRGNVVAPRGNVVAPSSQTDWTDLYQILRFQSHFTFTIYCSVF